VLLTLNSISAELCVRSRTITWKIEILSATVENFLQYYLKVIFCFLDKMNDRHCGPDPKIDENKIFLPPCNFFDFIEKMTLR